MTSASDRSGYSHPRSLQGRVAIVTGAARGVGKGIATALLQRGASVLLTDILDDVLEATTAGFKEAGLQAHSLVADLRDADTPQRIVDTASHTFGAIHALVNNAVACNEPKAFGDISAADYDLVYDTGPRVTFALMQAVHPHLLAAGGGAIVNIGSAAGTAGERNFGAYAGAKEAIRGMSKVAALEWGRDGIRVNVVCPLAETDGLKVLRDLDPKRYQQVVSTTALKRIGDPATDIGPAVAFLIGDDAAYITGQTILLDGGAGSFR
ncbi:SDR family oxidoreductase [Mycobacterium hackensackense]|uniref:SDR family NAD(P)-dependent oxidoreductase n=1 Tax=Mycobacterium hackensackense TaxID=228909 RepID=UPI002265AA1C|nr:SDR family NAD(P)-dependent oxidoreductase [Mycobacterium hackensackense]MCV7250975.1 SDR family oxidoreductase [Mycobacterium hackensackense]